MAANNIFISWQECLIENVRDKTILFDKSHPEYHDSRGAKMASWRKVVGGMKEAGYHSLDGGLTSIDTNKVIEKWGNMRDSFRKSAAKMATKSGDAAKKVTPYKYFEQMRWLLDYNKPRHTTSNITLTNVENGEENDDDDDEENSPPPPIPRRKRKSSAVGEQILQQISSTGNIIKDMAGEKYSKEKAFGQVMADMIEEIPEGYDRDMLKLDIHKLILERKHKYMALESYRE